MARKYTESYISNASCKLSVSVNIVLRLKNTIKGWFILGCGIHANVLQIMHRF